MSLWSWWGKNPVNSRKKSSKLTGYSLESLPMYHLGKRCNHCGIHTVPFESKFESKFEPLQIFWQLVPKAITGEHWRFWRQNQWPSSWGRARLAGRASANTGRFQVCGSRCVPRPARLRKVCGHSCDTDSVRESKRFICCVCFGPWRFFMGKEISIDFARPFDRPKPLILMITGLSAVVSKLKKV